MIDFLGFGILACLVVLFLYLLRKPTIPYPKTERKFSSKNVAERYDFIIVGAGSAGCVIASELVKSGKYSVLLIEGGYELHKHPHIQDPKRFLSLFLTHIDYDFQTVPQINVLNRVIPVQRGRALGGCSTVNGTAWVRGCKEDYDNWEKDGDNKGWNYQSVLPLLKKLEDVSFGDPNYRGKGGLFPVIQTDKKKPIVETVLQSVSKVFKLPFVEDYNGENYEGISTGQYNVANRKRCDAFSTLIEPLLNNPLLTVVSEAQVQRILIKNNTAYGVEYLSDGELKTVQSNYEVILSAGVINSPQLLCLSGIGPSEDLKKLKIPIVYENNNVGKNYHDHILFPVGFTLKSKIDFSLEDPGIQQVLIFYQSTWSKQNTPNYGPDIQIASGYGDLYRYFFGALIVEKLITYKPRFTWLGNLYRNLVFSLRNMIVNRGLFGDLPHRILVLGAIVNQVKSRGSLRVISRDPNVGPLIDPNTLSSPEDLDRLVEAVKFILAVGKEKPFADLVEKCEVNDSITDQKLRNLIKTQLTYAWHPVGTCKMSNKEDGVVDSNLKVKGVQRLRVADASIMPSVVSGNTHIAALLIGLKASELILKDYNKQQ